MGAIEGEAEEIYHEDLGLFVIQNALAAEIAWAQSSCRVLRKCLTRYAYLCGRKYKQSAKSVPAASLEQWSSPMAVQTSTQSNSFW